MEQINELAPYLPNKQNNSQNSQNSHTIQTNNKQNHNKTLLQEKWARIIEVSNSIRENNKLANHVKLSTDLEELIDEIEEMDSENVKSEYMGSVFDKQKNYLLFQLYSNLSALRCMEKKKMALGFGYLERAQIYLKSVISASPNLKDKIFLKIEHIKLMFNQCSIVSQMGNHEAAANFGSLIINQLVKLIKDYLILFSLLLDTLNLQDRKKSGFIDFRLVLLKEAEQKLDHLSHINSPSQLVSESKEQLNKIAKKLYSWKANLENNEKYLLQSLNIQAKNKCRNILGIAQTPSWIEQFNIGDIMSIRIRSIDQDLYLNQNGIQQIDPFFLFSRDKITELCIFTSISYFVVATQTRLKATHKSASKQNNSLTFFNFSNSSDFDFCKILHLKAIEIAGRFLSESTRYITHLIFSFNKNYKKFMENITEQQSLLFAPSHLINPESQNEYLKEEQDTKTALEETRSRLSRSKNSSRSQTIKRKRICSSNKKKETDTIRYNIVVRKSRSNSISKSPIFY